jgi:hypothetical protein
MQLERVAVGGAVFGAVAGAIVLFAPRSEPEVRAVVEPVPSEPVVEAEPSVPPSRVRAPERGCGPSDARLVATLDGWLAEPATDWVRLDLEQGVTFIHSEVDTGRDGPLPRSYGPEAKRVCGSEAVWLRSHVREVLRSKNEISCCAGVCTYDGGVEYAPSGTLRFEEHDRTWVLVSWEETYVTALSEEYRTRNTEYVEAARKRLAGGRCTGETPGLMPE